MVNWANKLQILFFLLCIPQRIFAEYYNLEIDSTGVSHLIILQDSTSLEPGFEVGIFDLNAILNSNNCENVFGELLVGYGVIPDEPVEGCGNTLCIGAIGSIDLCDIGGEQIPGFVEDSPIVVRVWDPFNNIEYSTIYETNQTTCSSETFSGLCTSIIDINLDTELGTGPFYNGVANNNSISSFPNPAMNHVAFSMITETPIIEPILIFDINGRLIKTLMTNSHSFKNYTLSWDISTIPQGIYFVGIKNQFPIQYSKLIILK